MNLFKHRQPDIPEISRAELQKETEQISRSRIRIKTAGLILAILLLIGLGALATSAMATNARSFPIMMSPYMPEEASISLSATPDFEEPTVHLDAPIRTGFTNISGFSIPSDVDGEEWGSHNGEDYIAYTFFIRNNGEKDIDLAEKMNVTDSGQGADGAVRVRVYRDGTDTCYARLAAAGVPEVATVPFQEEDCVFDVVNTLAAGQQRRYTIVIWLEGDDPDCTDEIKGGTVRFFVDFTAGEN